MSPCWVQRALEVLLFGLAAVHVWGSQTLIFHANLRHVSTNIRYYHTACNDVWQGGVLPPSIKSYAIKTSSGAEHPRAHRSRVRFQLPLAAIGTVVAYTYIYSAINKLYFVT